MTIYCLFGKTGSGKSYIGQQIENMGVVHIDGDQYITDEMKTCLVEDKQMTPQMIDRFVDVLIHTIKKMQIEQPNKNFVISQALYLDEHRKKILAAIPQLRMVHIVLPQVLREVRIEKRFEKKQSTVSTKYAKEMDQKFEEPTHPVIKLENNHSSNEELKAHIADELRDLDLNIPVPPGNTRF